MEKNVVIAFILSTLVIVGFYFFFPPVSQDAAAPIIAEEKNISQILNHSSSNQEDSVDTENLSTFEIFHPYYTASIVNQGGFISSFELINYDAASEELPGLINYAKYFFLDTALISAGEDINKKVNMVAPIQEKMKPWLFKIQDDEISQYSSPVAEFIPEKNRNTFVIKSRSNKFEIEQNITFYPDTYLVDIDVIVKNISGEGQSLQPSFQLGNGNDPIVTDARSIAPQGIVYHDGDYDLIDEVEQIETVDYNDFEWVGMMDTYFIHTIKKPATHQWQAKFSAINSLFRNEQISLPNLSLIATPSILERDSIWQEKFQLFIGPKKDSEMEKFSKNLEVSLDLEPFDFLAQPMLSVLRWFYSFTKNWGIAIILLTIFVRLLLFPLSYKGMKSMKKMQKLTPKIQTLRTKYAKNKERLNKEILGLYKKHKVNPMGGCFPLLLQIPIFIALYYALLPAIELRHSPFIFWVQDLSKPDNFFVLPILMGVTMFLQQKLVPTQVTLDPMQQKIMKWFPVILVIFFFNFPSGLVLYYVISNIITILQQSIINRVQVPDLVK